MPKDFLFNLQVEFKVQLGKKQNTVKNNFEKSNKEKEMVIKM